jgi:hypothetical protein
MLSDLDIGFSLQSLWLLRRELNILNINPCKTGMSSLLLSRKFLGAMHLVDEDSGFERKWKRM